MAKAEDYQPLADFLTSCQADEVQLSWSYPAFVDTETLGMMPGEGVHRAKEPSPISGVVSR